MEIEAWSSLSRESPLERVKIPASAPRGHEVEITVTHCGLCQSDLSLLDRAWGDDGGPVTPGHEIVGVVRRCGADVERVRAGQRVGVGWQSGACLRCALCLRGDDNLCRQRTRTCVGRPGGFASRVTVDARFVFALPDAMPSYVAAPLMCAGATVYAPLARLARAGATRVGIIGLGGLGHLAVQFARALGCEVSVLSSTPGKAGDAAALGAHHFINSTSREQLKRERGRYDLLLSTVAATLPWSALLRAVRPGGEFCFVGVPAERVSLPIGLLVDGQRRVSGSLIASRAVLREMLEVSSRHGIAPRVERVPMSSANEAVARVRRNLQRYRVVLERPAS